MDVIEIIARKLAEDNALKTLAQLNLVSHDVHEETLPALYETLTLRTPEDMARIVDSAPPKGFKYVK